MNFYILHNYISLKVSNCSYQDLYVAHPVLHCAMHKSFYY